MLIAGRWHWTYFKSIKSRKKDESPYLSYFLQVNYQEVFFMNIIVSPQIHL